MQSNPYRLPQPKINFHLMQNLKESYLIPTPNDKQSPQIMLTQFQTLKKINHILDSNPQNQQTRQTKIKSLVIMFKRQVDITKKLQSQIQALKKVIEGKDSELLLKNRQCEKNQETILELTQKNIKLQDQRRKLGKQIQMNKEEMRVRQDLIEKMKSTYESQKQTISNQLNYIKQKTLERFKVQLNSMDQQKKEQLEEKNYLTERINDIKDIDLKYKTKSKSKPKQKNGKEKLTKQNIIQRNIMALVKGEKEEMTGEALLKKLNKYVQRSKRVKDIHEGKYSTLQNSKNFKFY